MNTALGIIAVLIYFFLGERERRGDYRGVNRERGLSPPLR